MPKSKKKPSAASQIVITPSTSIISRLDEVRGWTTGEACLMCNERPRCPESYIGQCRQCLEAGRKALREQQKANKAFRGTSATAALMPQEGND